MTLTVHPEHAITICVEITENYANRFLAIFNNVKSEPDLYKIRNDYGNKVFVTCNKTVVEDTKEWLAQFGEIKYTENTLMLFAEEPDYDFNEYDGAEIEIE